MFFDSKMTVLHLDAGPENGVKRRQERINAAVFPGLQGGPHNQSITAGSPENQSPGGAYIYIYICTWWWIMYLIIYVHIYIYIYKNYNTNVYLYVSYFHCIGHISYIIFTLYQTRYMWHVRWDLHQGTSRGPEAGDGAWVQDLHAAGGEEQFSIVFMYPLVI